jgi:hypothetical protein
VDSDSTKKNGDISPASTDVCAGEFLFRPWHGVTCLFFKSVRPIYSIFETDNKKVPRSWKEVTWLFAGTALLGSSLERRYFFIPISNIPTVSTLKQSGELRQESNK